MPECPKCHQYKKDLDFSDLNPFCKQCVWRYAPRKSQQDLQKERIAKSQARLKELGYFDRPKKPRIRKKYPKKPKGDNPPTPLE